VKNIFRNLFSLVSVILLFLIFTVSACKPEIKEVTEDNYPDGSPKIIRAYEESGGKKVLVREVVYYPNHNKQIEGEFKNNLRHGKWTAWFENGKIQSEGFMKNGKNDGLRVVYYSSGVKYYEGRYEEGKSVGVWRFYNEDGSLSREVDFGKGK